MEEGVRGVSPEAVGVVVERLARSLGLLRFVASVESLLLTGGDRSGWGDRSEVPLEEANETTEADGVEYRFAIDLCNGKEVPTGLRAPRVELVHDGRRQPSSPYDSTTGRQLSGRLIADTLEVVNIPPRQVVRKELHGYFGKEVADALKTGRWERIEFVAERPARPIFGVLGSKTYRKTLAKPCGA